MKRFITACKKSHFFQTFFKFDFDLGNGLPHKRTIQRHLAKVPFDTGTLHAFGEKLKTKIQAMHPNERVVGLNIDGAKIKPCREFDSAEGSFIGHPTVNPPQETMDKREKEGQNNLDRLATEALCVMVCGLSTRWKQLIGWHLCDNSFDPLEVHAWLVEIIEWLQSLGLTVVSLTMDQGPGNQAI